MSLSAPITRRSFARLATALPLSLALATKASHSRAADGKLNVVASFSILADWASNIGGDAVDVVSIVPPGGDTHTFDPDPETVARIADADVIFAIGAGFEGWLSRVVEASGTDAPVVEVSQGITLLTGDEEHDHDDHDHDEEDDHDHDHGDHDPHIWGDVANAIAACGTIRDALVKADPDNADTYEANAKTYQDQLASLDTSIRDKVATVPEDHRKLVTSHDTFGYYAHAYGFEIIGTALGSFSTEVGDPSARDIATLIDEIKASGVPAIFAENIVNPALMESIAEGAGVELAPPLYSDALGEPGSDGDTYIHMMEYNTTTIVEALGGK
ncbi:MAG TPA: zinc ABC transporter substrate-binding protein [Thermomicrobiales bacterium]|nr:zinc ABC transporter substrate-binding protein [Thermomicrobiales bacterium]